MIGQVSLQQWGALLVVHVRRQACSAGLSRALVARAVGLSQAPSCYRLSLVDEQAHPMFGRDSLLPRSEALVDEQAQPMIGADSLLPRSQSFLDEPAHPMIGQDSLLPPGQALLDERARPMHGQDLLLPPSPALLDD